MSSRMEKVDELVGQEVAKELQKLLPEYLITVTEVEVSKDLGFARVWITSLGEEKGAIDACYDVAPEVQAQISKRLTMRKTPKLRFQYDHRGNQAQKIEKLLREIKDK